jgi:signal transduction histidine kinase
MNDCGEESGRLLEDAVWLVGLRWIALGGVAASAIAADALGLVPSALPFLRIAAVVAVFNVAVRIWLRRGSRASPAAGERHLLVQLVVDVGFLTCLLHHAGGVENPFVMFFAFLMAIGAMLLPRHLAFGLALSAVLLHGGAVVAEAVGLLPHHPLLPEIGLHRTPSFVAGYLGAFALMLGGTSYFVHSIAERHRRAEALRREHERVALSRERLARVGELAAGVAHSTRNPLHGLLNAVEILSRRFGEDDEAAELLGLMRDGLRRIENVTRRLLALTREAPLEKAPTDLAPVIDDALQFVVGRARNGGIAIETRTAGAPRLEADPDRLGEALINVFDNALDACGEGDRVRVDAYAADGSAWIEVLDTGQGIPAEHVPRVFDPFFTTKAVGEGSGLGLALTRRIVEQHGGEVSLASRAGEWTRVRIRLPCGSGEAKSREART